MQLFFNDVLNILNVNVPTMFKMHAQQQLIPIDITSRC